MWLLRHQNCFSDGNEKESIITDNSVNKDPFPEVWRSGKGHNHSSALHSLFQWDESRAPHLLQLLRQGRRRPQEDESQHCPMQGRCQVTSDGAWVPPVPLCSPVCSEPAQSKGEHRREFLPHGWENLCWKVFLEVSPSSLYMQRLCLITASIKWQIYCLADYSPSQLHDWESSLQSPALKPWLRLRSIISFTHTNFQTTQGLARRGISIWCIVGRVGVYLHLFSCHETSRIEHRGQGFNDACF